MVTDDIIFAMARQPDGNILIGGSFNRVGTANREGIARVFGSGQAPNLPLFGPFVSRNGFELSIPTVTNHLFYLEFKNSLDEPQWQPISAIAGDGSWKSFTDPAPPASQRFYRVRVE